MAHLSGKCEGASDATRLYYLLLLVEEYLIDQAGTGKEGKEEVMTSSELNHTT